MSRPPRPPIRRCIVPDCNQPPCFPNRDESAYCITHDDETNPETIAFLHRERTDAYLPGDDVGTAWTEAEAALPDGWHLGSLLAPVIAPWGGFGPHEWEAHALDCNGATRRARGLTPVAALRALTARLKEANRE